jgi:hypothetical protein
MALNHQQQRIVSFLAQGLSKAQVGTIVGCSPSYITQLGEQEDFKEALVLASAEVAEQNDEDQNISTKYLAVEHKVLKTIEDQLMHAEFPQLVQALKVIGERQEKRAARKAGLPAHGQVNNLIQHNTTILNIPAHAIPEYQVDSQGQVISIGDRVMAPMGAAGVKSLFSSLDDKKGKALTVDYKTLEEANSAQGSLDF